MFSGSHCPYMEWTSSPKQMTLRTVQAGSIPSPSSSLLQSYLSPILERCQSKREGMDTQCVPGYVLEQFRKTSQSSRRVLVHSCPVLTKATLSPYIGRVRSKLTLLFPCACTSPHLTTALTPQWGAVLEQGGPDGSGACSRTVLANYSKPQAT